MPFISTIKESFAFSGTDITQREKTLSQAAVEGTSDWFYYQGLILLQKLSLEVKETNQVREPTEKEASLMTETKQLLKKYKDVFGQTVQFTELSTRFNLLTYFINVDASTRFINKSLNLNLPTQQQKAPAPNPSQTKQKNNNTATTSHKNTYPTTLYADRFDNKAILRRALARNELSSISFCSWSLVQSIWPDLSLDQKTALLEKLLLKPVVDSIPLVSYLKDIWQPYQDELTQLTSKVDQTTLFNLTLRQMDELINAIPSLLRVQSFVTNYLDKLVPSSYTQDRSGNSDVYDSHGWNHLNHTDEHGDGARYLTTLDNFADKLADGPFASVKARITFYKLRSGIVRDDFDQDLFTAYLKQSFTKKTTNVNAYGDTLFVKRERLNIEIPLIGNCYISEREESPVIEEYLSGLLRTQKMKNLEAFSTYFSYKSFLEPLQANVLLTHGLAKKEDMMTWAKDTIKYEALVKKSELKFGLSTLHHHNHRLTTNDPIQLDLSIKNIPNVTLRVFPIDLYNYWKLHPRQTEIKDGNKLNVDGLCPIYEQQYNYHDVPSIQVIKERLVFGNNKDTSTTSNDDNVFHGRGAWVFDFVGGREQNRAIIQKGYLRYIVQNTSAGHLFLILDEYNQPIKEKCSIWYENNNYESDESGNILVPYRVKDSKRDRALIVTEDGFCQPFNFYFQSESYSLDATFYVNHETLIPTKQSKVIISPKLKIQYQEASLKLLEKVSLTLTTTNGNDIKSSTTIENLKVSNDKPIEFEFTVPSSLKGLSMVLSAQVKTMFGKEPYKKVECSHEVFSDNSDMDGLANYQLRKNNTEYLLNVFGKNGEPLKQRSVQLNFDHKMLYSAISITMQTDDNGIINLGQLDNISSINISSPWKQWSINKNQTEATLPSTIHANVDTEIKIPFIADNDYNCSLFQTGIRGIPTVDFTSRLQCTESGVVIQNGLPEGSFCLYYRPSNNVHGNIIDINISKNALNYTKQPWDNWIIGKEVYMEKSGDITQDPLFISNVNYDKNQIKLQLKGSSASLKKAFVIATLSTFVPTTNASLASTFNNKYDNHRLEFQKIEDQVSASNYLIGRKLSEEYQYILNRSKQEKYIGSTLTDPSLLINPKKDASTSVNTRSANQGNEEFTSVSKKNKSAPNYRMRQGMALCGNDYIHNPSTQADFNFGFLNHSSKVLVLQPKGQDEVLINRGQLGEGNLLQITVVSGEQLVGGSYTLSDVDLTMNINDQRQTDQGLNVNGAYLRKKTITILSPSHPQDTFTIDQNQKEFELIDSQDALLDIFNLLAKHDSKHLEDFDIIRRWENLSNEEKIKSFNKLNSHEFNLWLKFKDTDFFNTNVKPLIKSKIHKTFMDDYLIDAELTKYANNLYAYQLLSTAEKALLAKRVPDILPVVLRHFKDTFEPPLSDEPFDTVLAGNTLNLPPPSPEKSRKKLDELVSRAESLSATSMQYARFAKPASSFGGANNSLFGSSAPPPPPPPGAASGRFGFGSTAVTMQSQPIIKTSAFSYGANVESNMEESFEIIETEVEDMDEEEGNGDDDDEESDDDMGFGLFESDLREQAIKLRQKQKAYEYIEPTSQWIEKNYYGQKHNHIKVNQFWIDYLENNLDIFISRNIIYATSNITEIIFALALTDLPTKSKAKYEMTSDLANGKVAIVAKSPLIIFYRVLKEYSQSLSTNPFILLGQHFFEKNARINNNDEQHIVEPNQLLTETTYGWHLAVSNISSKTKVCELTLQIPTGAVPLGNIPYSQSKTIKIQPYSTWREVIGSFYFPTKGNYHHFAVTIGEQRKTIESNDEDPLILLNQTQTIPLIVSDINDQSEISQSKDAITGGFNSHASWSMINNTGTDQDVLTFVERYDTSKLNHLDWSLVAWRMMNATFARSLLDILVKQKYYVKSLYAYGLYHRFNDIVSDLLEQERFSLLKNTGVNFESPLVNLRPYDYDYLKVLDYYPVVNARVHCLGSSNEIINQEFFKQYNQFLDYLNQGTTRSFNDYIIFSVYLLVQGRIKEAKNVFNNAESMKNQEDENKNQLATIQMDYLKAYLATRIQPDEKVDIGILKEYVEKYKTCASLRWQKQSQTLGDLVNQLENGIPIDSSSNLTGGIDNDENDNNYNKYIASDPVFDFTIKDNQVVIRYANLNQCQVRFYKINVEVMFSNQPFLNKTDNISDYSWVKANHKEIIDLTKEQLNNNNNPHAGATDITVNNNEDDEDFEWIGIQKVKRQRHSIPIPLTGNVLIEVSAHGKTQCQTHLSHSLTVHLSEQYGVARVLHPNVNDDNDEFIKNDQQQQQPLSGVYVKVYAKLEDGKVEFWKDGYTSLTGIFDYISVTQGNGIIGNTFSSNNNLKNVVEKIKKFSLLFTSEKYGVVTKEAYPPF
ncbi:hypothetical protein BJ944DRAFT_240240 [Cunninghamella echinulata]|nr:hypothetical protein BJ944DRAFT_240240 [Cunninghamella echinulata]